MTDERAKGCALGGECEASFRCGPPSRCMATCANGKQHRYVGRWLGHDQPGDELGAFLGMHFEDSDLIGGEGDLSWNRGWQRQGYVAAVDVDRLGDVANGVHLYPLADSHLHVDTRGADC